MNERWASHEVHAIITKRVESEGNPWNGTTSPGSQS